MDSGGEQRRNEDVTVPFVLDVLPKPEKLEVLGELCYILHCPENLLAKQKISSTDMSRFSQAGKH